jgi:hypothetical protein
VIVVVPAAAGAWTLAGPGGVVGLLTASGTVAEVRVERVGAVVGSRGLVVGSTRISLPARLEGRQYEGGHPAWR